MNLPFFEQLEDCGTVLIAGAGGGFDIFAGLPLYFWLRRRGKTVHLANMSFADLSFCPKRENLPQLVEVRPDTSGPMQYFPERCLAQWLQSKGSETQVHAIALGGVQPVLKAYNWLYQHLNFDTIILVDGGTDILMRGDEAGLGTPEEDISSLAACQLLEGPVRKFIACLGFGIDTYHGVCHAHFLENAAALASSGDFLGAWSLLWEMEEMQLYADALDHAHARTPGRNSIVNSSIVAAAKGLFGNVHSMERTRNSELFINPLMAQYWTFNLSGVARQNLYLNQISSTETRRDMTLAIAAFRDELSKIRPWVSLPV